MNELFAAQISFSSGQSGLLIKHKCTVEIDLEIKMKSEIII